MEETMSDYEDVVSAIEGAMKKSEKLPCAHERHYGDNCLRRAHKMPFDEEGRPRSSRTTELCRA